MVIVVIMFAAESRAKVKEKRIVSLVVVGNSKASAPIVFVSVSTRSVQAPST